MAPRRNKQVYTLGLAIENPAAKGTYIQPIVGVPYDTCGLKPNITEEELKPSMGSPGSSIVYRKQAEPGGSLKGWAWPENGLAELLLLAFGAVNTTRNIADTGLSYKHEFNQDYGAMLTASLTQYAAGLVGYEDPLAYPGSMLKSLKFGFDGPGPVSLEAEFISDDVLFDEEIPTVTYSDTIPFVWGDFKATLDGVASGKNVKAAINFEMDTDALFGDDGSFTPKIKTFADWNVNGTLQFPYESPDPLREYITGSVDGTRITSTIAAHTLKLECKGANIETGHDYLLNFKMPWIQYKPLENDKDADKTEMYDVTWVARKYTGVNQGLGTNKICSATLVDKQAIVMPAF